MGKKAKAGRSFFSNLPLDLRSSLRSQTLVPLIPGANINDLERKQEALDRVLGPGNDFLPTQPASPGSSDDGNEPIPGNRAEVVAESSTSAKKRALSNEVETPNSSKNNINRKKRKQPAASGADGSRKGAQSAGGDGSASASASPVVNVQDKGKGKGKGKEVNANVNGDGPGSKGNRFKGHRWDCTGLVKRYKKPSEMPSELVKYWYQRQFLLPEYDRLPLLLDDTGWFSITPQPIAAHIAERCSSDVIIDAFCGVGGNTIEFAKTCERVIAIDNHPIRLRLARHNALQLGVADRIEFILGDFVTYAKSLQQKGLGEEIDVVFLSPPWGGTEYLSFTDPSAPTLSSYPLSAILPMHGKELFDLCSTITPNIAYYLPRNVNIDELSQLARPLDSPSEEDGKKRDREWVEVEEEWVGDKLKAVTAYYGGLISEE